MRQVYGTQGGGLAKRDGNTYIFVEIPPGFGDRFRVGSEVPLEWDIQGPFDQDNGMEQVPEEDIEKEVDILW